MAHRSRGVVLLSVPVTAPRSSTSAATGSHLAFLPHHKATEHVVLAVVDRGDGPEAEVLVSLTDAPSATMLAAALNGIVLQQVTAERRLAAVL